MAGSVNRLRATTWSWFRTGPSPRVGTPKRPTISSPMTRDDVTGASPYRLYQATADELWVLCPREPSHRARCTISHATTARA